MLLAKSSSSVLLPSYEYVCVSLGEASAWVVETMLCFASLTFAESDDGMKVFGDRFVGSIRSKVEASLSNPFSSRVVTYA